MERTLIPALDEVELTVNRSSTPRAKRSKRQVETMEFLSAARRFIRGAGKRCADGDEVELGELIALHGEIDAAVRVAVAGIKGRGMSWTYIASATGVTREAAYKRWGKK